MTRQSITINWTEIKLNEKKSQIGQLAIDFICTHEKKKNHILKK